MASLAAQAAIWTSTDGAVAASVMETLLQCSEQCTALGAELGSREPAGHYALQLALAVARNLKYLMGRYPCGPYMIVEDVAARMHLLLMATTTLAEQEWSASFDSTTAASEATSATVSDELVEDCSKKIKDLWLWNLSTPVDDDGSKRGGGSLLVEDR